ncbi:hypothetical protein CXU22_10355 [Akkermansia muciniphila]|uniref:TolC family protein n=1 Tax=Akkermansia muciniphila TaxID=239935 RepID=A0A2N8HB12_9BACT|nr:TolC family protein [Akkermansia muciniphila]PNC17038.1 hypothetical protein CXU22_10355 [Akkermansia muciniphila]
MKSIPFFAGLGLTAFLSSCSVYHSAPIDLNAEEASWKEASRVDTHTPVTRNQARQIGLVMNPDLNKARLKLASSNEAAKQSGWWNDPSFSWDIEQVLQENTLNMAGSLGFTIPVTGLPALEKKVAEQYKEADFWTLRQAELDFLSSLDQAWSKLAVTRRRQAVIRERLAAVRNENSTIEKLIGAGEVEFSSRQVASQRMNDAIRELQTVTETELEQKMELIRLMGLHPSAARKLGFRTEQGFQLPPAVPTPGPSALTAAPKIKAQLATYATTETLFKTEIRRQYPELELGPSFTRDDGEKEVGGEIGFNIPLWNRNRKAVAESRGARDMSRQETIQLWKTELFNARQLDASQQMVLRHCRTELQRMESFASSVRTMEKLHGIGEASLLELAENRHQLYESRLAFLDNLDKLLAIQAQLRYLTHANLQSK